MWPDRLTFTGATDNSLLVALCTISTHPLWVWPDRLNLHRSYCQKGWAGSPVHISIAQQVWPEWLTFTGPVVGRVELVALCTIAHTPCGCGSAGMVTGKSQRTAGSWQSNARHGNNWTTEQGKCHGKCSLQVVMDTPCVCISVDLIMYKLCKYIYIYMHIDIYMCVCVDIPTYHILWSVCLIVSFLCCFKNCDYTVVSIYILYPNIDIYPDVFFVCIVQHFQQQGRCSTNILYCCYHYFFQKPILGVYHISLDLPGSNPQVT